MTTRRIGAAWKAAQNSVDCEQADVVVTLMVRFDSERQKLSSPVQLLVAGGVGKHWLLTSAAPKMVVWPGVRPSPATSV